MLKNTSILFLFLLSFFTVNAQYKGGSGDGYAMGETKNIALSEPEIIMEDFSVNIYPNPAAINSYIAIAPKGFSFYNKDVTISTIHGKLVYQVMLYHNRELKIHLSPKYFGKGIYIIRISGQGGRTIQKRLIIG